MARPGSPKPVVPVLLWTETGPRPMPSPSARLPKYRHYLPKNLAVVRIDGRDVYLGRYDSPESHEKYRRTVAEWLTTGRAKAPVPAGQSPSPPLVSEIILAFWKHAETYYRTA